MAYNKMTNRAYDYGVQEADWDAITNNFDFLNNTFHVPMFPDSSGLAPSSGLTAAAYSVVQSSGAGTNKPEFPLLDFDAAAIEGRIWTRRIPRGYTVTPTIAGKFIMASATSGNVVVGFQIAALSDTDTAATAKVFATENTATVAVPATAGIVKAFSITGTNFDSAAAIDWSNFVFYRKATDASDTATGDMRLMCLDLFFSLTATTV